MTDPILPPPERPGPWALVAAMGRDRQVRRLIVASLFAAAFVWVAVDSFRADPGVVWGYFLASIVLIVAAILAALLVALLITLVRRWRGARGERGGDA